MGRKSHETYVVGTLWIIDAPRCAPKLLLLLAAASHRRRPVSGLSAVTVLAWFVRPDS